MQNYKQTIFDNEITTVVIYIENDKICLEIWEDLEGETHLKVYSDVVNIQLLFNGAITVNEFINSSEIVIDTFKMSDIDGTHKFKINFNVHEYFYEIIEFRKLLNAADYGAFNFDYLQGKEYVPTACEIVYNQFNRNYLKIEKTNKSICLDFVKFFRYVYKLEIDNVCGVFDKIKRPQFLQELIVKNMEIDLKDLVIFKDLKHLTIKNCKVTNLDVIKNLNLKSIKIVNCGLTDVNFLIDCDTIENVDIRNNKISDISNLLKMKNIKSFNAIGNHGITLTV
jgi:hypothetical protein